MTPDKLISYSDAEVIVKTCREGKFECVVSCEMEYEFDNKAGNSIEIGHADIIEQLQTKDGYAVLTIEKPQEGNDLKGYDFWHEVVCTICSLDGDGESTHKITESVVEKYKSKITLK